MLGYRFFKCEWNIGDVFAYKFESSESKEKGSFGKYILFQKIRNTGNSYKIIKSYFFIKKPPNLF